MANTRRRLIGTVVSDKMEKTVTVQIENRKLHPIYKKVVKTTKKLMAHDESNSIPVGAVVRVVESKPLSKNKRWVVEEVLSATGKEQLTALPDEAIVQGGEGEEA
ncbi:MAG: 30S ribosomal protein S17 [Pleurocapsa minor GSE-CHR-MK-17-07R]|jgi:small subunit ribosomal protein S17|nr:30S ribosomal protein S17 [Pleurocapsa minor GSE-CHR-MK 17-07R]